MKMPNKSLKINHPILFRFSQLNKYLSEPFGYFWFIFILTPIISIIGIYKLPEGSFSYLGDYVLFILLSYLMAYMVTIVISIVSKLLLLLGITFVAIFDID